MPGSAVRLAAVALCAALLVAEHVRLAVRAFRGEGAAKGALALLVPGAGAVLAWRAGARASAVAYAVLAVAYAALLSVR